MRELSFVKKVAPISPFKDKTINPLGRSDILPSTLIIIQGCGSYIYFEASLQAYGVLSSGTFMSASGKKCLSFAFSMYSLIKENMGVLHVALTKDNLDYVKTLWTHDGAISNTPEDWRMVSVPVDGLTPNMKYRVSSHQTI